MGQPLNIIVNERLGFVGYDKGNGYAKAVRMSEIIRFAVVRHRAREAQEQARG